MQACSKKLAKGMFQSRTTALARQKNMRLYVDEGNSLANSVDNNLSYNFKGGGIPKWIPPPLDNLIRIYLQNHFLCEAE